MRALLFIALSVFLFAAASCDDGSNPTGGGSDTIYVVDSTKLATMSGRVEVYRDCESPVSARGVKVEIPELGVSVMTDDSGWYTFKTSNVQRYYRMRITREGTYSSPYVDSYAIYVEDSGRYMITTHRLYTHFDYSGELKGDVTYKHLKYPAWKDTTIYDSNGDSTVVQVPGDSLDYSQYIFSVVGLNGNNNRSNRVAPVIFVSDKPGIDPLDPSTYVTVSATGSGSMSYQDVSVMQSSLELGGIKSGQTFYAAAGGMSTCSGNVAMFGTRLSPVIEVVRR